MSSKAKPSRTLWFSLVVWAGASVAALSLTDFGASVWPALAVAAVGGLAFGWLSARRVDGRRTRRRRRHRGHPAQPASPAPPE